MDFNRAFDLLMTHEGGFSNHPDDPGGATMYGVTQATYNSFRKTKGRAQQTVRNITHAEAREVYETLYWKAAGCDKLPWPVSYITFDAAVNSGPKRAVGWTQSGLRLKADGAVGPNTIAAAQRVVQEGDGKALLDILDQRVAFLARLVQSKPSQAAFLLGWWRRTMRVLARAVLSDQE